MHPARGATRPLPPNADLARCFNSRTPCGVRPGIERDLGGHKAFQFTHPVRGATASEASSTRRSRSFNSRTPCGVRLPCACPSVSSRSFNSRTPCGVRLSPSAIVGGLGLVSIHAPRAGCDVILLTLRPTSRCFNSRTPCGVRLVKINFRIEAIGFNSRTPCGVRPSWRPLREQSASFQFTHPVRGATCST